MRTMAVVAALLGMLAVTVWFAYASWVSIEGPPMPAAGYWAMGGGVVISLLVGFGLMALLFYSSRHGHDDLGDHRRR